MCYSLWYNAPTMLPAVSLEAEEPPLPGYRPTTSWVYCTTSCKTQSSAPEDGQSNCPKHVELIEIINKPLLLSCSWLSVILILSSYLYNCMESLFASSSVQQNVPVSTLFSDSTSLYSSHKVRHYVAHPKT